MAGNDPKRPPEKASDRGRILEHRYREEAQLTSNPIGIVICRVGAVLLAVSAVRSLGFVIAPLLEDSWDLEFFLMFGLMTLTPLISAFLLWVYADQISTIPFAASRSEPMDAFGSDELINVGIHLIGIYVLVFGVVHAFDTEALAWAQSSLYGDSDTIRESMSAHTIGSRVSYAVQIVLGLVLLIRGKKALQ